MCFIGVVSTFSISRKVSFNLRSSSTILYLLVTGILNTRHLIFISFDSTLKELYKYMIKNSDQHKVASSIVVSGTRFSTLLQLFIRNVLILIKTKCDIVNLFESIGMDFMKFRENLFSWKKFPVVPLRIRWKNESEKTQFSTLGT